MIRDGQEDEEDCSDIPSFTKGLPPVEDIDDFDNDVYHLLRLDIEWTHVEEVKKKKRVKLKHFVIGTSLLFYFSSRYIRFILLCCLIYIEH